MAEPKLYGQWVVPVKETRADQIQGFQLRYGPDGKPATVAIQFVVEGEGLRSFEFPFLDAMFALSGLKSIQLDSGIPFPDDPRSEPKQ